MKILTGKSYQNFVIYGMLLMIALMVIIGIDKIRKDIAENRNELSYVISGMPFDKQQLFKIQQTEKIIQYYNPKLKKEMVHSLAITIVKVEEKYPEFDHVLLSALIATESSFDPTKVSPAGAKGLMQLMDGTAEDQCSKMAWGYYDGIAFDPEKAILMGSYYLSRMVALNKGNLEYGLAYYNGGYKHGARYVMYHHGNLIEELSKETREYPGKVFKQEKLLRNKFKFSEEIKS